MKLPTTNPTAFCTAFIENQLAYYKEESEEDYYLPVMERIIERADELQAAFAEIIEAFGYADFDGSTREKQWIWLTLELMWWSFDGNKKQVAQAKQHRKKLQQLNSEIVQLARQLTNKLQQQ